MLTLFRWLMRITAGLLLLAGLAVLTGYWFLSRSLVDYNEGFTLEGISAPVEVVRNNDSVPHIFGKNDHDTYFALGFAHAQDRLWQMTMLRRTAQGRLSEIFGERTLAVDELIRRYDLYGLALESVKAQDPETLAVLEAYSAGVNAWINEVNTGARGRGAPEFWFFAPEIAAWAPADSIAILKLMALQLTGMGQSEVLRARASLVLSPERLADILPEDPTKGITSPNYASLIPGVQPGDKPVDFALGPLSPLVEPALSGASNAWAAMAGRSAAGGALLANDPHLGFTAPTIWYLARLELQKGGVIGATIPGIPVVMIGRSEELGWGLTTAYLDDQDIVIEKLNPDNQEEYLLPDGTYERFITRQSVVRVKDGAPITLTLRWSRNGPVLSGKQYDLQSVTPTGHVAVMSWTALSPADTSMTAAVRLMSANTVADAIEAGRLYVAPAQNLMLAGKDGIAMQLIGAMPIRDAAHPSQGRMPSPGWVEATGFKGIFPYEENPRFVNPPEGILGNTNNKTVDRPFPNHVSFTWGDTQRIQAWLALIRTREVHTRESFMEAQLDTMNPTARLLLPLIGADLWFTGGAAETGTAEEFRQRALKLLAAWNGEMSEHAPEPLIAEAWLRVLMDRLIRDELGPLAQNFRRIDPVFLERVYRNIDGAAVWCDVVQSAPVETCTDMARMALDEALIELSETYGRNIESWRWGDAHQATHDHPVLGNIPFVRWFVNIRQSTSGGDDTLMRGVTKGSGPEPYLNVHGAGYRGVYDFADPDSSIFITATGQSGHPLSRHYDDLGELWRRGEYIPMSLDPDLAHAAAAGVMLLTPASAAE
ncbi:penicillin acylase family protein [Pseudomonas sp. GX19020]|uniref:penicillin acylase family protein n=1 Tax=Pseudomonas sp. GX19020 TaxID=2942277 RepID=UPI0020190100|nr:penicillin acylase family protein [Pseudomonas sp. GX19020]MCL4065161.1 penicillin acylase family protein [Pseudomonas sp. GX19020]